MLENRAGSLTCCPVDEVVVCCVVLCCAVRCGVVTCREVGGRAVLKDNQITGLTSDSAGRSFRMMVFAVFTLPRAAAHW